MMDKIDGFLQEVLDAPINIQVIMRNHGLAFTDLDDPMQKLAFTIYTDLVELALKAENLLEERRHIREML